jgi:ATP-dependent NAD(P)H-hydrate dehydratase
MSKNNIKTMLKLKFETQDFISMLKKILPKLTKTKSKGDNGVVAVIGGSLEYTGAPYYGAISSLYTGSDLSHVFCHVDAAIPIKCYSPELIVHPAFSTEEDTELLKKTARWFKSMDSILIGPGLGREDHTYKNFNYLIKESLSVKSMNLINLLGLVHVLDADAMWHYMQDPSALNIPDNNNHMIFTPNRNEFERFYNKLIRETKDFETYETIFEENEEICHTDLPEGLHMFEKEIELANKLNNKIIVKKVKYWIYKLGAK